MALVQNVKQEIERDLDDMEKLPKFQERKAADPTTESVNALVTSVRSECGAIVKLLEDQSPHWFNIDGNFSKALTEAVRLRYELSAYPVRILCCGVA